MNRRQFITASLLGGAGLVGGAGLWLTDGSDVPSVTRLLKHLERLNTQLDAGQVRALGEWNLAQIFQHCTQSVRFSLTGFPEHKPDWFQHSVGPLAFSLFSARGAMSHDLSEAIPGAPVLDRNSPPASALQTLMQTLQDFDAHSGTLAPHFAFGALSKQDYARAHVLHIRNHLQEIREV